MALLGMFCEEPPNEWLHEYIWKIDSFLVSSFGLNFLLVQQAVRWGGFFYILELNLLTRILVIILFIFFFFPLCMACGCFKAEGQDRHQDGRVSVCSHKGLVCLTVFVIVIAVVCSALSHMTNANATFSELDQLATSNTTSWAAGTDEAAGWLYQLLFVHSFGMHQSLSAVLEPLSVDARAQVAVRSPPPAPRRAACS